MESEENKRFVYEFGKFVVDPDEKTLFIDGSPVHLPAKEFETLLLLLRNNRKALSKEQMLSAVWRDSFVEESNLAKQVSKLRKILNTNGERFIETIPKHGYRFSADLRIVGVETEAPIVAKRRTVRRVTFALDEEPDAGPPLSIAKQPAHSLVRLAGLPIVLIALGAGAAAWFWPPQQEKLPGQESGFVFLTDGSYEDAGARLTNRGHIYFSRYMTDARVETWVMNADGSNARRANSEIKSLLTGVWSPDGNKVVFVKEGEPKTIYLANSDATGEVVLPISGGNMDWSPDGSQFVHQAKTAHNKSEIHLYTIATGENRKLADAGSMAADPSFSYDGTRIAFTAFHDGNAEIYVINADGTGMRRITDHPAYDNFPVFSPDGTAVAFQSNRGNDRTEIYLQNLNNAEPPIKIASFDRHTSIAPKSWSADGSEMVVGVEGAAGSRIARIKVGPYPAETFLADETAELTGARFSPDGSHIVYQARLPNRSLELRLTDLKTKRTQTILTSEPNYPPTFELSPSFSPDGSRIVFTDRRDDNSDIYIVDIDGSNLERLTEDPLPDGNAVFTPDGKEVIFDRNFYGATRFYRMNVDGSDQRQLMTKGGFELSAAFAPDGQTLTFSADRQGPESRGLDIFLTRLSNPDQEIRIAALKFHESAPAFSPDGRKIAFVATRDENQEIYVMNADSSGLIRLTRSKSEDILPRFSPDGRSVIFSSDRTGKFALYSIALPE
jgi:Tol biopolymer transport system component/DNA-binding winged helix-turn-helix (wHTH) protein